MTLGLPLPHRSSCKFSLFRQPPARSYPHAQYSFSSPQPFSQHPLCTSHLQTLDSIDSRVNSYPFLPYFIHQLTSIDPATPIVPTQCRVPPPQDATIDHCPNSIPPFQRTKMFTARWPVSIYISEAR
ncbi:hypothetical protein PAPYR_9829 [Paratrimastix pyriformis]|uniref:Uncharacterized protein n=1 Tax=Paratrimastix pyriformis TaxID=342808 RepID=A0ABQ8U9Y9_9EUKA|nr:hypothetical protein PAPYR_9829 [Paratrimastix pyriformis]